MLIRIERFRLMVIEALRQGGWQPQIVAQKAGVGKSTMYRLLSGQVERMRAREVLAIAEALGLQIEIVNNNIVDLKKGIKARPKMPEGRENKLRGIIEMLREVDAETLEFAEELTQIAVSLQKNELIELRKVIDVLRETDNRILFVEKLQAIIKLLIPYEGIIKQDENSCESRLSSN